MKSKKPKSKISDAYKKAMEEFQKEKILELKAVVKKVFERQAELQAKRKEIDLELKTLNEDIRDLKAGKLDRIKARQEKCKKDLPNYHPILDVEKIEKQILPAFLPTAFSITGTTASNATANTFPPQIWTNACSPLPGVLVAG